ncbi:MAG: hypothetical protein ACRCXC_04410 [Legionella sp.]
MGWSKSQIKDEKEVQKEGSVLMKDEALVVDVPLHHKNPQPEVHKKQTEASTETPLKKKPSLVRKETLKASLSSLTLKKPQEEEKPMDYSIDERTRRHREYHLLHVRAQLIILRAKQVEFSKQAEEYLKSGKSDDAAIYQKAADAAQRVHQVISDVSNQYVKNGDLEAFKTAGKDALKEDNEDIKTLHEHRGLGAFFTNLAALIFTAGLAHAGYSLYKRELSLFKPLTNAGKAVVDLHETVHSVAAPSA